MSPRPIWRIGAGAAAIALLAAALYGSLWAALGIGMSAHAPDPFVPDGDPCCGHPDDWGEVAVGITTGVALTAVVGALLALVAALALWSVRGRWPRWCTLALVPAGISGAAVALVAVALVPELDEGRTAPDCGGFRVQGRAFHSANDDVAKRTAHGIVDCRSLAGWTVGRVSRAIGHPDTRDALGGGHVYWSYDYLDLRFEEGKVVDADFPE